MKKDTPERRAQIRAEVNKTSKEAFILEEMKRLGIWPDSKDKPSLQEDLIARRTALIQEIRDLSKRDHRYQNREAELNKYKKERLRKSKEKQQLNKQRRKEEKEAKAEARKVELGKDIKYLGQRYSHTLKDTTCDSKLLTTHQLGHITNVATLAEALDLSVYDLRFLCFDRKLSKNSHYISYGIKKKNGSIRKISAPKPKLKKAQRAILDHILSKFNTTEQAHGFVKSKSIVSNAQPHVGADIVVNMDLKDFFPTVSYPRVFGLYKKMGFSGQLSTLLALLSTMPENEIIKVHGEIWHLNYDNKRCLPQGAATSPMLTNLICRKMDRRLNGIAKKINFKYTRYADDLTFSGPISSRSYINKLKWQVKSVIKDEDFTLHPDKTHIMVPGHRKEVTGIVVNEKLNISKKKLKAFRALLHQVEKDGFQGKTWGDPKVDLLSSIEGFARYIYMVNPQKGKMFLSKVAAISNKYRPKPQSSFIDKVTNKILNTLDKKSKKPWWKIWD